MKQLLVLALVVAGSFSAHAINKSEEGQAITACGIRSHFLLGKVYTAGLYGSNVLTMEFTSNVDSKTVLESLAESGMSAPLIGELKAILPKQIIKGDVLKFIETATNTTVLINKSSSSLSKGIFAGVLKGVKAKIGSDWQQPCKL